MMLGDKKCFAFIFARGGSKGIPKKNIRCLNGVPLIGHAIAVARKSIYIDQVIVSTDDAEIADTARQWGAAVPFMRPPALASDISPEILSWKHAVKEIVGGGGYGDFEYFVSLPATAPFRNVADVDGALECLLLEKPDLVVGICESERNPYFNMVEKDDDENLQLVCRTGKVVSRRQDAPKVYDITTVIYATTKHYVMEVDNIFAGQVRGFEIPRERALDIDTEYDFSLAEFLLTNTSCNK